MKVGFHAPNFISSTEKKKEKISVGNFKNIIQK